jgi:hypothetical protein
VLFAELEMAANAAVLNQLTNVMVGIGGESVPGLFRKPSVVASQFGQDAADARPSVTVASSAVMDKPYRQPVTVAGTSYVILEDLPDGTGLTTLMLGAAE